MFAVRRLTVFAALGSLAACAPPSTSLAPVAPAGRILGRVVSQMPPAGRKSWIKADAQRESLLYISESNGVTIYSNPSGNTFTLVGELFGFQLPGGECVDKHGNIFVTDLNARTIVEYAHGSVTPKAVITDNLGQPYMCAVDQKSGRLAVTDLSDANGNEPGNVLVYSSPSAQPTEYSGAAVYEPLFCGFDSKGNLFVDAYDSGFHGLFSELANGSSSFVGLSISGGTLNIPGGVQADGTEILLGDSYDPKTQIYQLSVSGTTATVVNKIALASTHSLPVFTLFGSGSTESIIAPDYDYNSVQIYSYPGGSLLGSVTGGISYPIAAVISQSKAK